MTRFRVGRGFGIVLGLIGLPITMLVGPRVGAVVRPAEEPSAEARVPGETEPTRPDLLGRPQPPASPNYAKGQLIVKFKSDGSQALAQCAHCLFQKKARLATALQDFSSSLDTLNQQAGVHAITPLFPQWHAAKIQEASQRYRASIEAAKRKFPKRTARAPKNAALPDLTNTYVLQVPEDADIEALVAQYAADPHVAYAQPNYLVEAYAFPETLPDDTYVDPDQDGTWSTDAWGQGYEDLWGAKLIQAHKAWKTTQGEGIVVAVVDTGLDYTHPDIAANVWTNPGEDLDRDGIVDGVDTCPTPNGDFNCIDDDGNGYLDDIRGWSFASKDNDPMDRFGHGTHVSGTIAAVGNNGIGIIGVAPKAKIMAIKGLDDHGSGTIEDLAKGIVYAAQHGADVLNNSWGCLSRCPSNPVAEDAVRVAHGLDAVVVFAAGNSSDDVAYRSPQNMTDPKPVVVAATTQLDQPTFFTNFGVLVDVAAPGGGTTTPPPDVEPFRAILSLKSTITASVMDGEGRLVVGGQYLRQAGTSMAAPHASGVAALVLANHPTFTNDEVRHVLRVSADDLGRSGFDSSTGAGRLDAAKALEVTSVLTPTITAPRVADALNPLATPTVDIVGTAEGAQFAQYQLAYQQSFTPLRWTPIGSPSSTPVHEGRLGQWPITALAPGQYTLRLEGTTTDQRSFHAHVPVFIEPPSRQLTTDASTQWHPAISGHRIVWEDHRGTHGHEIYLCEYDAATGSCPDQRITTDPASPRSPAISGPLIIWLDSRTGDTDIYLYDMDHPGQEHRIATGLGPSSSYQGTPRISGHRIAWEQLTSPGNSDIYLCVYDPATGACPQERLTSDPTDQIRPAIAGDLIVWQDHRNAPPGDCTVRSTTCNTDIYLYDLVARTEVQITTEAPAYQIAPHISDRLIIWADARGPVFEEYTCLYDVTTQTCGAHRSLGPTVSPPANAMFSGRIVSTVMHAGPGSQDVILSLPFALDPTSQIQRLTFDRDLQRAPAMSEKRVVWEDLRHGNWDIYLYEGTNAPPDVAPLSPLRVNPGEELMFPVFALDPDGDLLTLTGEALPSGAGFQEIVHEDPGYLEKIFRWTPRMDQCGRYAVGFTAKDWELETQQSENIIVNCPPLLTPLGPQTVKEGRLLQLAVSATDPDGDTPLDFNASRLPPGATFDTDTATFTWTPTATQAGEYRGVRFEVSDGELTDSEEITITVKEAILAIAGRIVTRGDNSPVANVTVQVRKGTRLVGSARTGPDGRYELAGLASGAYEVRPQRTLTTRFQPAKRVVRLRRRDALDVDFVALAP